MLAVSAMIGSGKTTLTTLLAEHLGTQPFYEPVEENPILPLYYEDQKKYGFHLQLYFLNKRFKMIKDALKDNNNILDRFIGEDKLFAYRNYKNGNMLKEEWDMYSELLDNMMEDIDGMPKKSPDLLIYLETDFETVVSRIKKRGRDYEQFDESTQEGRELRDYYYDIWSNYDAWYEDYDWSDKIKVDLVTNDLSTPEGRKAVLQIIDDALLERGLITKDKYHVLMSKLEVM